MEENNYDELDEIFVDKNTEVDKRLIVDILKPFITIDHEGILDFTEEYEKLRDNKRALVYFVAKKAMILREIPGVIESIGPTELSKKAHISESSAKHAIFRDYKKILKKEKRGYIVPNHKLKQIKEIIFQDGN